MRTYTNSRTLPPAEVGLNGVTLAAERTSSSIASTGWNQLSVAVNLTARTAATTVTVSIDFSPDAGTTWYPIQTGATAAGVVTLSDAVYTKAVSAADTFAFNTPIAYDLLRLRLNGAGGAAGDVASVTVLLGLVS